MVKSLKYRESVCTGMPSSSARFEDLFKDPSSLQIMYCLAENNPNLTMKFISKKTDLLMEVVEPLISKMTTEHLVEFNTNEKGYTLTPIGLATLYNFHKSYIESC
ncbi:MAG: hypothetical protein Q8N60_02855 [Candidatus Diapherotrites archaeon]|nr:hypothetical protein [Candidatus Diapherotrites archaeon]